MRSRMSLVQEVGGSKWKTEGLGRGKTVASALIKQFPAYWCSGLLCNPDTSNEFSALGSIFLVRQALLGQVQIWQFAPGEPNGTAAEAGSSAAGDVGGWLALTEPLCGAGEPLGPSLGDAGKPVCRHSRFQQHFFPEYPG